MIEAEIYKALGDPIRLEMVRRLSTHQSSTIGALSKNLGISRQGARKQLQVLVDANIARLTQQGRETQVALDTHTLKIAQDFIAKLERQWDARLNALKTLLEE
ncbi:MAG: helix-turn-helix domain-containing protein [Candidatus Thiodiazotropha sp.]